MQTGNKKLLDAVTNGDDIKVGEYDKTPTVD